MLGYAVTYLRISCVGLPFVLITYVGHGVMRGVNQLRKPLQIVVVANVVNIVLEVVGAESLICSRRLEHSASDEEPATTTTAASGGS